MSSGGLALKCMHVFLLHEFEFGGLTAEGGFIFMMKWNGISINGTNAGFVLLAADVFKKCTRCEMDYIKSENTKTKETKQYKEMEARTR